MDDYIKKLTKKLGSRIWPTRKAAAEALGKTGDPAAVQPLADALKDHNESVRSSAVEALGNICDPSAVQPLIVILKNKNNTDFHGTLETPNFSVGAGRNNDTVRISEGGGKIRCLCYP